MKSSLVLLSLLILSACGSKDSNSSDNNTSSEFTYHYTETYNGHTCDTGVVAASSHEGYCNNLKTDNANKDKNTGEVCAYSLRLQTYKHDCNPAGF